jgi:hypothetical protein
VGDGLCYHDGTADRARKPNVRALRRPVRAWLGGYDLTGYLLFPASLVRDPSTRVGVAPISFSMLSSGNSWHASIALSPTSATFRFSAFYTTYGEDKPETRETPYDAGTIGRFNGKPSSENNHPGHCASGKLFGEFFSLQTLPSYLWNGYNQVGKLQSR